MTNKIRSFLLVPAVAFLLCSGNLCAQEAPAVRPDQVRILTDYPSLQAAVDSLPEKMGAIYVPAGTYVIKKTVDLTEASGYGGGIKIFGAGRSSRLVGETGGTPIFDLTGASHCHMYDLHIESKDANIGFLLARRVEGGSAQEHRFDRIIMQGHYSIANVYNVTAELVRFTDCIFIQHAPDAHNVIWSSENHLNVKSPYRGELRTLFSNTEFRLDRNTFYNWGDGTLGCNIYVRGFTVDLSVTDSYVGSSKLANILFEDSSKGGPVSIVKLDGLRVESKAKHVILVRGRADGVSLKNCSFNNRGAPLIEASDGVARWWQIENVWFYNTGGRKRMLRFGDLEHSHIDATWCTFRNWGEGPEEEGPAIPVTVTRRSHANTIVVPQRESVELPEQTTATVVVATDDNGARRRYASTPAKGEVLNLEMVDVSAVENPKPGDVALDNGSNTASGKPALAVFTGEEWRFAE